MYLFTREARLNGRRQPEAMALAVHITEYCTQLTGVQRGLWANVYSQDVGSLVFASVHPDLTALETTIDKLNVDSEYHSLVDRTLDYVLPGTVNDAVWNMLYPEAEPETTREVNYTLAVEAYARPGKMMAAAAWGPELCQLLQDITGIPDEFGVDEACGYGRMILIQQFTDAAEYERCQAAQLADPRFPEAVDQQAPELFETSTATRRLYRRIV